MRASRSITLIFIAVLLITAACATKTAKVVTYEEIGTNLAAAYNVLKPACDQGRITPEKCLTIKNAYNEARRQYISAGDILKLYVTLDAAPQEQAAMYAQATGLVVQMTADLTRWAIEAGLVK